MSDLVPLFPLGTVLYPGQLLPLHIFEDRYRQLVGELLAGPQPGWFGVIAIRAGRETGAHGITALHEIGCTATMRRVEKHADGRYDLVTIGSRRFRLVELDASMTYLRGRVELLDEAAGADAEARLAAGAVREAFRGYLDVLARRGLARLSIPDLPADPVRLSYLVAAAMVIELPDHQALLAEPDAAARLAAERVMLVREITMLRSLGSAPAPYLRNSPYSPN